MKDISAEQIRIWTRKIAESDREAFQRLFRLMYPRLVRFACKYVRNKAAAADIVQDAFVALWENREQADHNRSLKAYLYTMVRNRSLNHIRDHSGRSVDLEQLPEEKLRAPEQNNAEHYEDEQSKMIRAWIRKLPKRQQEAFELSRFEGLDHQEIATVMDISPNTVNNHIVAALRTLKEYHLQHQKETN